MTVAVAATLIGVAAIVGAWLAAPILTATPRRLHLAAVLSVAAIVAWFYVFEVTTLSLALIPWDDAVFFDRLPLYVAIVLLVGICAQGLRGRPLRGAILVIGIVFSIYAIAEVAAPLWSAPFVAKLNAETSGPPEVTQSTGWSCGAAALAWAVRIKGVPAGEMQMAELAVTGPIRGSGLRGMIRALHRVGLQASARRRAKWDDLVAAPKPAIVDWKLGATIGHVIVVTGIEGETVTVGDPLIGETSYSREEFLRRWDRELIVIE